MEDRDLSGDAAFFLLRERAYALAESARFKSWMQIEAVLRVEGFLPSLIERLGRDALSVMMITRCCALSRG